ncbi:tRNA (cytosine(72)-C(5))-methyltransferase NSUN6 [Panulirus ornatus]|uniref:tRNA (cytosine(72)-C(5))-methyltransferase NSUN6 n=1 Tax=Panulirus ornatus TaxID=150431 RepID=UPI003A84AEF5
MDPAMCSDNKQWYVPGDFNPLSDEVTEYIRKSLGPITQSCQDHISGSQDVNLCTKESNILETKLNCDLDKSLCILSIPPKFTTVRVNLMNTTLNEVLTIIKEHIRYQYVGKTTPLPLVYPHHTLPDLLVIESFGIHKVQPATKEVVVGRMCGSAVLRGAEVYAPGVLGASPDLRVGESVAVYADLDDSCLRGCKVFSGRKMFIGNGTSIQGRKDLFKNPKGTGLAVSLKEQIFDFPSLGGFLSDLLILQNLPSVLCGHILKPDKQSKVLDMCAAPGGKTTHIASLMCNTGLVIAIDRSQNKVDQIISNAKKLDLSNIVAYKHDSTNLCVKADLSCKNTCETHSDREDQGFISYAPPYKPCSFKWILLDAPCSALGQRPQIQTKMKQKELQSFPVVQRKLLQNAVKLLEPGGKLVYSTCTILTEENEKNVKWLLDTFQEMELVDTVPKLGKPGMLHCGLNREQCEKVQRFHPLPSTAINTKTVDEDTIGFFIAAFKKI